MTYDKDYFLSRDIPECANYRMKILRPGDMGAALCYALGYTDYSDVQLLYGIPDDQPDFLPTGIDFKTQALLPEGRRTPKLVVSVGAGRGELDAAFSLRGIPCIGIEPSVDAAKIYLDTQATWGNGESCLITAPFEKSLHFLPGYADTFIFCESLEHIPGESFQLAYGSVKNHLMNVGGLAIFTNWITNHPIYPDGTDWDHVQLVDEAFYDRIAAGGKTIFRKGSHLVVRYGEKT